jgi:TonB family protein
MRKLFITLVLLFLTAVPVAAQDPVSSARELYASARYDEALAALNALRGQSDVAFRPSEVRAVEQVRSLCLLALGRDSEAEDAIAAVIAVDPFYQPADADTAPRVRAAFQDVRRRMLPEIASERYASAKATYDQKEFAAAAEQFTQVLTLLGDDDMQGRLADLRTLANGFLELSAAAVKAAEAANAPEPAPPPAPAVPAAPKVYGPEDPDVVQPVTIRQELPRVPSSVVMQVRERGVIEVTIDELGRVESAAIRLSVHTVYDQMLLGAAADWRYRPATVNGQPVKFRKRIAVTVARR